MRFLTELWSDFRFTARTGRKNVLLALIIVGTLALGIGISTGIFTIVAAIGLRAQVDHSPESFVQVYTAYTAHSANLREFGPTTLVDYFAFRSTSRSLRLLAAWQVSRGSFGDGGSPDTRALLVTCNFFSLHTLEHPRLGRLLQEDDCSRTRGVAVITEETWRSRFGADPDIIGRVVHYNSVPLTVVGVAPSPFAGRINRADLWVPYTQQTYLVPGVEQFSPNNRFEVAGRLQSGHSRADVTVELNIIAARQDVVQQGRKTVVVVSNGSFLQQPSRRATAMFVIPLITGIVSLIVVLASMNVTTLLLARADARQREIAIRLALGASTARLLRMFVTETLALAIVAGVVGLVFAQSIPNPLYQWLTGEPAAVRLAPDWRVFLYLGGTTFLAAFLSGVAPAMQSMSVHLVIGLKGGRTLVGRSGTSSGLHALLVGSQIALSLVLLVGAGILLRAHLRMAGTDPGFETRQALVTPLRPAGAEPIPWSAVRNAIGHRIASLPGVVSFAWASAVPPNGQVVDIRVAGEALRRVGSNSVSPEFFRTLRIPLVRGRALHQADSRSTGLIPTVVSEQFTRELSPERDVLGRVFRTDSGETLEVVGVVRDTAAYGDIDPPIIYRVFSERASRGVLAVRFKGDVAAMARALTKATKESAPGIAISPSTLAAQMEGTQERFWHLATLVLMLGALGLFLAVIGVYGVVSFGVRRRSRELAVRAALGATRIHILGAALLPSLRSVAIGLAVGIVVALLISPVLQRAVQGLPFPIDAHDPLTYSTVVMVLSAVAVAAMIFPAMRAADAVSLQALRGE